MVPPAYVMWGYEFTTIKLSPPLEMLEDIACANAYSGILVDGLLVSSVLVFWSNLGLYGVTLESSV